MATSTFISSSLVSSNVYLWDKYGSNAYLNGGIALTRKAAADANGRFCWSSGTVSRFTNTATPKLYDPIYATAAATDQTVITSVTSVGATGIYAGGSGLLLAPTTRLANVEMTTSGGIIRSGDGLSFNALSAWSSGLGTIVSGSFVPLTKASTGSAAMTYASNTMYGNMFTPDGTATVTSVGESAGYGTFLVGISTCHTIRPVGAATNLAVPTEAAAAVALANKQDTLHTVDSTLTIDADNNIGVLRANGVGIDSSAKVGANWVYTVPSESAVRAAINIASNSCVAYADEIAESIGVVSGDLVDYVDALHIEINNSRFATQTWVDAYFARKGEGGGITPVPGSYGSATYTSMGMVMPVSLGGLVLEEITAALTLDSATSKQLGGIRIGSSFYTSAQTFGTSVYSHCLTLSAATDYYLGGIRVGSGLYTGSRTVNGSNLSGYLNLSSATNASLGGVVIAANSGINVNAGTISLKGAANYLNLASAYTNGEYAGVRVVNAIASTAANNTASATAMLSSGYVPSVQAVYNHVSNKLTSYTDADTISNTYVKKTDYASPNAFGIVRPRSGLVTTAGVLDLAEATNTTIGGIVIRPYTGLSINSGTLSLDNNVYKAFYYQGTDAVDGSNKYNIENVQVVDSIGRILYYDFSVSGSVANNTLATLYGTITSQGNLVASNATSDGVYGKYGWKNGTTTVYYTLTATPSVGDPVYGSRSVNTTKIIGYVSAAASSGVAVTSVTAALWSYTQNYTSTQNSAGVFCFPIAMLRAGLNTVETYQIQTTPVVSGTPLQGGKPVSQGSGAIVTDAIDSYVVALNKATTAAIGGVVIGNGIDINAGGTISVAASASAKPVSQGTGIAVTDAGGSYTVALNKAGTASIGGVQVPNNSGLSLNTTDGTLKLSSATNVSIGGVIVPASKGIDINNGSITLASASKYTTYNGAAEQASAGNVGGVVVMTQIASASTENESAASVVPTVNAVFNAISATGAKPISQGAGITVTDAGGSNTISLNSASSSIVDSTVTPLFGGVLVPKYSGLVLQDGAISVDSTLINAFQMYHHAETLDDTRAQIICSNFAVVDSSGELIYYRPTPFSTWVSKGATITKYATVSRLADVAVSGGVSKTAGYYGWSSGTVSVFTFGGTPAVNDPIFSSYNGNSSGWIIGRVLAAPAGGSMTVARWNTNLRDSGIASNMSSMSVPVAEIREDVTGGVIIHQLHKGPVISGAQGGKPVSAGWGITVNDSGGSYTVIANSSSLDTRYAQIDTVESTYEKKYKGDFAVTGGTANATISVAGGAVYIDGNTTARTIDTVTCAVSVPGGTDSVTLWLNIPKAGTAASATETPTMDANNYSVPLAYVEADYVCQYQHGPVVIRGRWA